MLYRSTKFLKSNIRQAFAKSTVMTFANPEKHALQVRNGLWWAQYNERSSTAGYFSKQLCASSSSHQTSIGIGNLQGRNKRPLTQEERTQRKNRK